MDIDNTELKVIKKFELWIEDSLETIRDLPFFFWLHKNDIDWK